MVKQRHDKLPSFLKKAIREKKEHASRKFPSRQAAAFLDFDGSLIEGDITEGKKTGPNTYHGLIDLAILGGVLPGFSGPEGVQKFWHKYENEFESTHEAYMWAGKLVANLPIEDDRNLKNFVIQHMRDIVDKNFFAFARDLLRFFEEEAIVPYIISASPHYFVEELGRCLPIASENLFGLNGLMKDGDLFDPLSHDAEGKEQRLVDLCASRPVYPLFALGNKWHWDGLMIRKTCEEGGVGLLVNEGGPSNYTHPSLYYFDIC